MARFVEKGVTRSSQKSQQKKPKIPTNSYSIGIFFVKNPLDH